MGAKCQSDLFIAHCKVYLIRYCFNSLEELGIFDNSANVPAKPLQIVVDVELFCTQAKFLQEQLFKRPDKSLLLFNSAVKSVVFSMARKSPGPFRVLLSSHQISSTFSRHFDDYCPMVGSLVAYKGVVGKISHVRLIQYTRQFVCKRCSYKFVNQANFDHCYRFITPKRCPSPAGCSSALLEEITEPGAPALKLCKRYQELRLQNASASNKAGVLSESTLVILEEELVETCWLGELVQITGVLSRRCHSLKKHQEPIFDMVVRATHVSASSTFRQKHTTPQSVGQFQSFWTAWEGEPLTGRNVIVSSFCPTLFQMFLPKLATLLVIIGGVSRTSDSGTLLRGDSHLLLIGDPGTGKSQILKFATRIAPKSVYTTGVGTTNAGLTCYAVKEDGEWQLEAGALPLAGGGICCIDEFSTMKECDMDALREAMEQQTVSVAKAGLVTKLNCQCSVIAACNFQEDGSHDSIVSSPLISRFDLVLCLRQPNAEEWTRDVCAHLLKNQVTHSRPNKETNRNLSLWDIDKLKEYVALVRTFEPTVTADAELILSNYFLKQRRKVERDSGLTTMRMLDSLIRLSQAHARLMFRQVVTVQDALLAVSLVDISLGEHSLLRVPDVFQSSFPANAQNDYLQMGQAMLAELDLQHKITVAPPPVVEEHTVPPEPSFEPPSNSGSVSALDKLSKFRYHSDA